ncbi:hypothetical protein BDN72DRAFT_836918 [Pluteus cervinus]|uniref:Uncharacterized protein n=1 Tax=Pluteus cervinus TaxID=181527 RepID=A0ACD3B2G8_9AGAR|nr:hypothetical protein BDN72DRAFT_836918 [Pluteus cervinus]
MVVSNFNPTLSDPALPLKFANHGSRLATFVQIALAAVIPLLGTTGVMIGGVADSFTLEQAPTPDSYASRSVNTPASITIDATISSVSTTQSFLSATVILFAIICGGMMVFKRQSHRQQGVEVGGESSKSEENRHSRKEDGQRRGQEGAGGQASSQSPLPSLSGQQGPPANSNSSTPALAPNEQPPPGPSSNRNPDGEDDDPNDETHNEEDHTLCSSYRSAPPPGGDGDDDPPPTTNDSDYDIPSRSRDSFNTRVLLVVAIVLCAFIRTMVFIAVRKRQSIRQLVVLSVEALDQSTKNVRSSIGVVLERQEWIKSLMKSSSLVFWTQLGWMTTTEEVQDRFLEEFEDVFKGKVHEGQEDTTITHKHAFGFGSSLGSRGVVVLSNVPVNIEPIQALELDYPIPLSVSTSTTTTPAKATQSQAELPFIASPSSFAVASSTRIISSNSIAILASYVPYSASLSYYPQATASLFPPLTEETVVFIAFHYFKTYCLTGVIVFFVAVHVLYGWMRWTGRAATTSGGLDTSRVDEGALLVGGVIGGEERGFSLLSVGGLELEAEREEGVIVEEDWDVVDDVEVKEGCCVEDASSFARCPSDDTSPRICATSRHQSPSPAPLDLEELEQMKGGRDLDVSKMFKSKFKKGDYSSTVDDADLTKDQFDGPTADICAPSQPPSGSSFKSEELEDALFCRHIDSLDIIRPKFKKEDNRSGVIEDDADVYSSEGASVNACITSLSRSQFSFKPEELENMRGGRYLDISKMFGSKFENQDTHGVSEDATNQLETDSNNICAVLQSSSFNHEELENMRGGRGLDASRMFNTKFQSISTSTSHPEFHTRSPESILSQSSSDSYSYSYSASPPNLSRFKSPPPLKRESRMLPLPSWWLSVKGDYLVSPLKPRQVFTSSNPDMPPQADWFDLASTSSVRKKPMTFTAAIPPSFSLAGCLGTPEPRSRSGLLSFDRDCVLPGLFDLTVPTIRRPKPSLIPIRVRTCRTLLDPVSLTGPSTQVYSRWGKKKFEPGKSRIPVLTRIPTSQAGPLMQAIPSQPKKIIRPTGSLLPVLIDKNSNLPPQLEVQAAIGPSTLVLGVQARNKSIYSYHCAPSQEPPRRRTVLEKGKLQRRYF